MKRSILGALFAGAVFTAPLLLPVEAGRPLSSPSKSGGMGGGLRYMNVPEHPVYGYHVEQQSPFPFAIETNVVNPRHHEVIWNVDDIAEWGFGGSLAAGESFTHGYSFMLDNTRPGLLYTHGWVGNGRDFRLTISVPELGFSYSQDFTTEGRFCLAGGVPLDDPRLSPVPDSNGGVGLLITVQWTITATDQRGLGAGGALSAGTAYGNFTNKDIYCGGHNESNGFYPYPIVGTDFGVVGP